MSDRLIMQLTSQQRERVAGHSRVGVTFGTPSRIFAAATAWANDAGRSVVLWRGGDLNSALASVGKVARHFEAVQDAALVFVLPAGVPNPRAQWRSLRTE